MFSFAAMQEYWDWLYVSEILGVGYTHMDYMDLCRTRPIFVYVKVMDRFKPKPMKLITNIKLSDTADIKPFKKFVGKTVKEMKDEVDKWKENAKQDAGQSTLST